MWCTPQRMHNLKKTKNTVVLAQILNFLAGAFKGKLDVFFVFFLLDGPGLTSRSGALL